MKLGDIFYDLAVLLEADIVYAVRPWSLESEAYILHDPGPDGSITGYIRGTPFEYFLEEYLIREIYDLALSFGKTIPKAVEAVMYYAENDAYPEDW